MGSHSTSPNRLLAGIHALRIVNASEEPIRTRRMTSHRTAASFFALPQTFPGFRFGNISGAQSGPGLSTPRAAGNLESLENFHQRNGFSPSPHRTASS